MTRVDEMPVPFPPIDVGECAWNFPPIETADEHGIVAIGADLRPSTLLGAYRRGLFPMPIGDPDEDPGFADADLPLRTAAPIGWWSPAERGILELPDLRVSRSLRRSCRRYDVTVNADFDAVVGACATTERDGGWISPEIRAAYRRLHRLGWAHSIETWQDDLLVGGLYGVQIGGLFAGESMFHTATDASKVALVALVSGLEDLGATLVDTQWQTDHLATLGVKVVTRRAYAARLRKAVASVAPSLASRSTTQWVANSPRFLERVAQRPMVPKPSTTT